MKKISILYGMIFFALLFLLSGVSYADSGKAYRMDDVIYILNQGDYKASAIEGDECKTYKKKGVKYSVYEPKCATVKAGTKWALPGWDASKGQHRSIYTGGCHLLSYAHAVIWYEGIKSKSSAETVVLELLRQCNDPSGDHEHASCQQGKTSAAMAYSKYIRQQYNIRSVSVKKNENSAVSHFNKGGVIVCKKPGHYVLAIEAKQINGTTYIHIIDSHWGTFSKKFSRYIINEDNITKLGDSVENRAAGSEYWITYKTFHAFEWTNCLMRDKEDSESISGFTIERMRTVAKVTANVDYYGKPNAAKPIAKYMANRNVIVTEVLSVMELTPFSTDPIKTPKWLHVQEGYSDEGYIKFDTVGLEFSGEEVEEISVGALADNEKYVSAKGIVRSKYESLWLEAEPYEAAVDMIEVSTDEQLNVIGVCKNGHGNYWYKLDNGFYVLAKHTVAIRQDVYINMMDYIGPDYLDPQDGGQKYPSSVKNIPLSGKIAGNVLFNFAIAGWYYEDRTLAIPESTMLNVDSSIIYVKDQFANDLTVSKLKEALIAEGQSPGSEYGYFVYRITVYYYLLKENVEEEQENPLVSCSWEFERNFSLGDDEGPHGDIGTIYVNELIIPNEAELLDLDDTKQLELIILPENADNKNVIWVSEVPEVASVDNQGFVTAHSIGETAIYAFSADGNGVVSNICNITVEELPEDGYISGTVGDISWEYGAYGKGTLLISGFGKMQDSFEGAPPWNYLRDSIEEVYFSYGLTEIGGNAQPFYGYTKIKYIELPDSLETIGSLSFYGCTGLTSIEIPTSVSSISFSAFYNCSSLQSITIPPLLTSIEKHTFNGCTSLAEIHIPDNVTSIGYAAFNDCSNLTNISLSANLISIGEMAFCGSGLSSLSVPSGTCTIGDHAFQGCTNLSEVILPDSIISIGSYAFSDCISLTEIVLPKHLTSVDGTFANCSSLSSVVMYDEIKQIGEYTFSGCSNLQSIIISANATSIGDRAFEDCSSLPSVVLPKGLTSIGNYLFKNCFSLISVVIPDTVTQIGAEAFSGCGKLESINIPNSVTCINERAFYQTTFKTIFIPSSVQEIDDKALFGSRIDIIYGYTGSAAEQYAKKYRFTFVDAESNGFTAEAQGLTNVELYPGTNTVLKVQASCILGDIHYRWYYGVFNTELGDWVETEIENSDYYSYFAQPQNVSERYACMVSDDYGHKKLITFYIQIIELPTIETKYLPLELGIKVRFPLHNNAAILDLTSSNEDVITISGLYIIAQATGQSTVSVSYNDGSIIEYVIDVSKNMLTLPENLNIIESEAFCGDIGFTRIQLPESLLTIGTRAFSETQLEEIIVSGMKTVLSYEAFDVLPSVILCKEGSQAEIFAQESGILYAYID